MQRALSIVLGAAAVVLVALLAFKSAPPTTPVTAATTEITKDAGGATDASSPASEDAGVPSLALPDEVPPPPPAPDGGFHLADGTPVAPLGASAPRQVRFGVVLVTYEGAQGAPAKGRSKHDALALATKLADEAKQDFAAAVQKGDPGSAADAGSVPRGVLEPAPEAVLFSLPPGGVSGVVDTPRGFWIVKRID